MFQAIDLHVIRKDYCTDDFSVCEGEMVQVLRVMPDGCFWKVATITPPFKEGFIPSDLLCPELPQNLEDLQGHNVTTGMKECTVRDSRDPVKVLSRFTAPPSVRKPVPAPRSNPPKQPTGSLFVLSMLFMSPIADLNCKFIYVNVS